MQTFETTAPVSAVLDIPAGRVRLIATDRTDTTVDIRPADTTKNRDVKAADQTTVTYHDGLLRIETPAKNQYFGPSGSVEVTIQLPTGSELRATAAAAELHATGTLGDVTFHGAHGQIHLDDAATLHLTAHVGDIQINRLNGPAEISVQKGDIHITQAAHGEVVLTTHAGCITVGAAPGVSAALNAATARGRIDNSLKNSGTTDLTIHATTSYGDITAHSL